MHALDSNLQCGHVCVRLLTGLFTGPAAQTIYNERQRKQYIIISCN